MTTSIFETLKSLQLTSKESRSIFNTCTRDVEDLIVWRDDISGVIYIDEFYTGDETYNSGQYRTEKIDLTGKPNFERHNDASRRLEMVLPHISGKSILEFGCGSGEFLKLANQHTEQVCGVELQQDYVDHINSLGLTCYSDLDRVPDSSIETCVSFHVLEHLPDPVTTLRVLKDKMVSGGTAIIEVPHANDFLLSFAAVDGFKQFTLWSQHLVLHTRESLTRVLTAAGFTNITIKGVQRYPLSNHMNWLVNNKPGGHKSLFSTIDSPELTKAYQDSLSNIDATDTLIAFAST